MKVFIGYCQKDKRWLDRLRVHLRSLERDGAVELWDDTQVHAGGHGLAEIRQAIAAAQVAILLISADFLASDFIASDLLPPLLAAAAQRGAVIMPVIVSACSFSHSQGLSRFKPLNDPARPLASLGKPQQEAFLASLSEKLVPSPQGQPAGPAAPPAKKGAATADAFQHEARRLDAAVPRQVAVQRPTEFWTQICLPGSKGFRARLPSYTESGDEITKKEVRTGAIGIAFPCDPRSGKALPVRLRVELKAPDFRVDEPYQDTQIFPAADSGLLVFVLVPLAVRPRSIIHVAVRQLMLDREWVTLGTVALSTKIDPDAAARAAASLPWLVAHLPLGPDAPPPAQPLTPPVPLEADAAKLEEIADYLSLSSQLLYSLIPGYVPKYKGTLFNSVGQAKSGETYYQQIRSDLKAVLAKNRNLALAKAQRSEVEFVLIIERWLIESGFTSPLPNILLAVLAIRDGLFDK